MIKILLKLKNNFLTNLPWKIAAFFMAFVLWFIIINVEDPVRTQPVSVTLELRNEDALATGSAEGIHLENIGILRDQVIRFQVQGTSRSIDAIRPSLGAYIDLSTSEIIAAAQRRETLRVPVQMEGYSGNIDIMGFSPRNVDLLLDTITTLELAVEVEIEGETAYGFELLYEYIDITPDVVSVTGPTSFVERIDRLVVTADVEAFDSSAFMPDLIISARDGTGAPVLSQHLRFENRANVELPIFRRRSVQILQPQYHAQSPEGYGIHSISWSPQWFEVAGDEDAIEMLGPIMLSPIPEGEIMNRTEAFIVPYDIRVFLPPGVFLIDPNRHMVNVEVFVEPFVQQNFAIPIEDIAIVGLPYNARVVTNEVAFTLSALRTIMAGVDGVTSTAFVNSVNLVEGYNEIPLVLALPARVSLAGNDAPAITVYVETAEEEYEEDEDEEVDEEVEDEEDNE
jgi:YbbR domain-containing protein